MERGLAARYAELYHNHWWWRAREAVLARVLDRLPLPDDADILDVGCGDGLSFPVLERHGRVRGIEVDESLLSAGNPARARIHSHPLGHPAYDGWRFDLITALDVIEHIEDDEKAIADMTAMLRPGGWLLVTVPAFMSLWDRHDELNRHRRRYTRAGLLALLRPHGEVRLARYLFPGLYVPKLAARLTAPLRGERLPQDVIPPRPVNRLLTGWLRLEDRLLAPLRLPFGTSVLALLRTPPGEGQR